MTFPKARLVVSACLFLAWLGFLAFLVVDSNSIILSRPQFMLAQLYVVADISNRQGDQPDAIVVEEVLWPTNPADKELVSKEIQVSGVADCVRKNGHEGAGKYLLPLQKTARGTFVIAPLPMPPREIRVYPWTAGTKAQVEEIIRSRMK